VVGVFAGILVLGEKPGPQEWIALTLVVIALFIVLFEPRETHPPAVPLAPDD
jgi:drug/metabolite transporter (DMT)-like permease